MLFDTKVEPDCDSMPIDEPEPHDPVAASITPNATRPVDMVQLIGHSKFRRHLRRLQKIPRNIYSQTGQVAYSYQTISISLAGR